MGLAGSEETRWTPQYWYRVELVPLRYGAPRVSVVLVWATELSAPGCPAARRASHKAGSRKVHVDRGCRSGDA
jgi:hypothetical protein